MFFFALIFYERSILPAGKPAKDEDSPKCFTVPLLKKQHFGEFS
jgi:hypothetical protein